MTDTVTRRAYAGEVKQLILDTPRLFVNDSDHTAIWFEKAIANPYGAKHTIADCLIFSEEQGVIGVEIKSAHDSKARLRRQLADYSKVCDYVWVLVHDLMLAEVEPILEDYPHVGIICYNEVDDKLAPGVVKAPEASPAFDLKLSLDMLWSSELYELDKRASKLQHIAMTPKYKITSKAKRINYLLKLKGSQYAHDQFVRLVTSGYKDPERTFNTYDFRRPQD